MQIRRLDRQEHGKTRELYEKVFCEDTKEFVDYYYSWKTRDNIIFAAEDDRGIHAMLHLNPFAVYVKGKIEKLHYIVAVATQEEYRHQGLMRRLLEAAEQEMAENGEKFTFLMPASEKIYLPFGYRYFAEQKHGILRDAYEAEPAELSAYQCRPIRSTEFQQLADLVDQILREQYDIFVWRDSSYYERLCAEQTSQNGAVMAVVCNDENGEEQLIGTFCTACEEEAAAAGSEQQYSESKKMESEQTNEVFHVRELILDPDHWENGLEAVVVFCRTHGVEKIEGINAELVEEHTASESDRVQNIQMNMSCGCEAILYHAAPLLMGKRLKEERAMSREADGRSETITSLDTGRIFINEVV